MNLYGSKLGGRRVRSGVMAGVVLGLGILLAVACAPAATPPAPTAVPTNPPTPPTAVPTTAAVQAQGAGQVSLKLVQDEKLGKVMADGQGRTLYLFTKDTKDTSNCNDQCAQTWPPLLSDARPAIQNGALDTLIGSAKRKDGSTQITY